ncbi:MAG TPA: CCA tRNA nucleotidyltransferase [Nitrospirae bacterium]|nr:CCA tRNA nucleotidyltransferase [Nitrospirota bacterium]
MDISKKILSDPLNQWFFSRKIKESYLVGGYVRDILRDRTSKDKDFVLKSLAEATAKQLAKKIKGKFIALKPGHTLRVMSKHKQVLDFSFLKQSINNDLKERDFTVNAIAWSPDKGIIDPLKGREDIKKGIIRAVRMKNLGLDPLRTLRAYRIAAELGFKIEKKTRKYLSYHSKKLFTTASERITEELFKLLSNPDPSTVNYLDCCYKDKVLENFILPRDTKKAAIIAKNIRSIKKFNLFLTKQTESGKEKKVTAYLDTELSQGLTIRGFLYLSLLLTDSSITATRLKISKTIHKALKDIHNGYDEINNLIRAKQKITRKIFYKIFIAAGERVYETAVVLAFRNKENLKKYFAYAEEFLKIKNKILLNGNEVQKILGIKPCRQLGRIMNELKLQQLAGNIKTRAEARKWLLRNYT